MEGEQRVTGAAREGEDGASSRGVKVHERWTRGAKVVGWRLHGVDCGQAYDITRRPYLELKTMIGRGHPMLRAAGRDEANAAVVCTERLTSAAQHGRSHAARQQRRAPAERMAIQDRQCRGRPAPRLATPTESAGLSKRIKAAPESSTKLPLPFTSS